MSFRAGEQSFRRTCRPVPVTVTWLIVTSMEQPRPMVILTSELRAGLPKPPYYRLLIGNARRKLSLPLRYVLGNVRLRHPRLPRVGSATGRNR